MSKLNNKSAFILALLALCLAVASAEFFGLGPAAPPEEEGPGPVIFEPRFGFGSLGGLIGGTKNLKGDAFNKAKDMLQDVLQKVSAEGSFNFSIISISWIKAKPESGMKFTFKAALKDIKAGRNYQCEVTILEQPWKDPSRQVSLDCEGLGELKFNF